MSVERTKNLFADTKTEPNHSRHIKLPSKILIRLSNRVDLLERTGRDVTDDLEDSFLSSEKRVERGSRLAREVYIWRDK